MHEEALRIEQIYILSAEQVLQAHDENNPWIIWPSWLFLLTKKLWDRIELISNNIEFI